MMIPSALAGLGVAIARRIRTNTKIKMRDKRIFFMTLSL
jgi:hypothetical protein